MLSRTAVIWRAITSAVRITAPSTMCVMSDDARRDSMNSSPYPPATAKYGTRLNRARNCVARAAGAVSRVSAHPTTQPRHTIR